MKLYRVTEAAEMIGISTASLRVWAKDGTVPVLKTPKGRHFWSADMIRDIQNQMIKDGSNEKAKVSQKGSAITVG